jgi:metallo-beta-lactamase family protein
MTLSFYGAAGEVTGSCCLVDTGASKLLVDCGMFQGPGGQYEKNLEPFPFAPSAVDAVLLTHTHLDHVGRVPKLVRDGFAGKIFSTHPTRHLAKLMWEDASRVMKQDARDRHRPVVYGEEAVPPAVALTHGVEYDAELPLEGGATARFHEGGHIFGSSFVELRADGKTVVFSGDLGNDDVPILRDTAALTACDALVLESTYGDRLHEAAETRAPSLRQAVHDIVARKGTLLIPAFSIERAQEIIYELNGLAEAHEIPNIPMFLDSPLAKAALEVYRKYPKYYDAEAQALRKAGDDFFAFPGLRITGDAGESRELRDLPGPKVIIAGSGMMHGGRVVRHLADHLAEENAIVLVVGYQAEGTLGRRVADGAKQVSIDGEQIEVRADVRKLGAYSAHADRSKLLRWLASGPSLPKKIVLTHGDPGSAASLAEEIRRQHPGLEVVVPAFGETVEV